LDLLSQAIGQTTQTIDDIHASRASALAALQAQQQQAKLGEALKAMIVNLDQVPTQLKGLTPGAAPTDFNAPGPLARSVMNRPGEQLVALTKNPVGQKLIATP
jgi:hypothetical protein